ncbi:MAG: hypothetical protein FD126_1957 [Elusimicrobia bacterium]|nr:MAG: hypothetical protein FD126_1957 [Elusimicrobiota bacterium]
MPAALALSLTFLAAPPAAAAVSTKDWPLTHETSVRLEREHAEAAGRLTALLETVERLRTSYKGSADPKAALAAWTAEFDAAGPAAALVLALNTKHRDAMGKTDRYIVVWSLGYAKTRDPSFLTASPEYKDLNARNGTIDLRTAGLMRRYLSEKERHKEAAAELARRLEQEEESRWILASVAAAALFFLAVAAYVLRRPKAKPAPETEPTPRVIHLKP